MAHPHYQGAYTVDTDTSDKQIGRVLLQKQPERTDKRIGYGYHLFSDREGTYDATHGKMLCNRLDSVTAFGPYLEGSRLTVHADHDAHNWILNFMENTGVLARWQLGLPEFEFDIVHCMGIKQQEDDALSRPKTAGSDQMPV